MSGTEQVLYANVTVDISHEKLDKIFQYRVPEALRTLVNLGTAVTIPFGNGNRQIQGYVIGLTDHPDYPPEKIKEIRDVSQGQMNVEGKLIALAAWMRDYYGSTMIQALKAVLPVRQKVAQREEKQIRLLLSEEEAQKMHALFEKKNQKARARLLRALLEMAGQNEKDMAILSWERAKEQYGITMPVVRALEEKGIVKLERMRIYRDPLDLICSKSGQDQDNAKMRTGRDIFLNEEQQMAVQTILKEWDQKDKSVYLLHGVTGSGKTEVYMELIDFVRKKGKQAIFLIPEIALTYQMVLRFYRRFGSRISVLHSRMSAGERYDQYEKAKNGEIDIMIGPRSALFTPFSNLGIIIIDEEHEESYKSETVPRYHARETAQKRAEMEGAKLVLGSATPSVESYYRTEKGEYRLLEMTQRANGKELPYVQIEDMRQEMREGNRCILSRHLQEQLEICLERGSQAMLFLNRRGYAGFVACRSCGRVIGCPHCNVSLSLHKKVAAGEKLVCHYCGYTQPNPRLCPSCGSPFIGSFQIGTQQVVSQVQKMFPKARILRMDADTTRGKDGYHKILDTFVRGEADILVGTQMIVKGHDFENVTLVGALAADLSLHMSDYRSAERTFQLLTQAAGRAGRGAKSGSVVIQTYEPGNYSIQAAAKQDYQAFYEEEILYRSLMDYPPVGGMLALHGQGEDETYLQMAMDYLKKYLDVLAKKTQARVIGPADESVSKVADTYRKVIYVRHDLQEVLDQIKERTEQYIEINRGFDKITIQYDRD